MNEKKYSKAEAKKEAERYLKKYPEESKLRLKDIVWSDFTNMPIKYRRPMFASDIINRIMR